MAKVPWWQLAGAGLGGALGGAFGGPAGAVLVGGMGAGLGAAIGGGGGGTDPSIQTKTIVDPIKTRVSNPLSQYLSSEIGKGLPRFDYEDPAAESRYTEFLGQDPAAFFKRTTIDPVLEGFRENVAPLISEGYAGALRGSGRFRSLEDAALDVSKKLTTAASQRIPELYGQQLSVAAARRQVEYDEWFASLPQNNPALTQAINFLRGPSGIDTAVALDPGREGGEADVAGILIDLLSAYGASGGFSSSGSSSSGSSSAGRPKGVA